MRNSKTFCLSHRYGVLVFFFLGIPLTFYGQTQRDVINYRRVYTYQEEGLPANPELIPIGEVKVITTYFDGLGRPMQQVSWQASPSENDIVQPITYDDYGREAMKYLPFVPQEKDGWYKATDKIIDPVTGNYIGVAGDFYAPGSQNKIADDIRPFSETVFEPSPLNRPIKSYGPGQDWRDKGKYIEYRYLTNEHGTTAGQEKIIAWEIDLLTGMPERMASVVGAIEIGGYYSSKQLIVNSTIDEHKNQVREYTNKQGQVILKKVQLETNPVLHNPDHWVQTYYIYDDFGNLRYILQPELVNSIQQNDSYNPTQDDLDRFAFQYKYDGRNRITEKKVPGAEPVYMVYDSRDRLVLTQDGNQRGVNEWIFTKYDILNRPVLTGIYSNGTYTDRKSMQGYVNGQAGTGGNAWYESRKMTSGNVHGYDNASFPKGTDSNKYLTATYYDDYDFLTTPSWDGEGNSYAFVPENGYEQEAFNWVNGQVTGSKVKVLGENTWLNSVNYYNDRYRNVQTILENYFGKTDILSSLYDFTGKVLKTLQVHNSNTQANLEVHNEFVYDHAGRLMETYQQIGDDPADKILMVSNEYNEIGELVTKNLHETTTDNYMQSVDYRYNIRGWLARINNSDLSPDAGQAAEDFFGMHLYYNYGFDKPQYNGNISGVQWKSKVDNIERAYGYVYDNLNRITGADYVAGGTANWTKEADRFEVSNITYDQNGNIQTLDRNGLFRKLPGKMEEYGVIDRLGYKYRGNQLMAVNDAITTPNTRKGDFKDNGSEGSLASPEYGYDDNGNMTTNGNKGITVSYNHLNLPDTVDFGSGKYIEYIYDAAGIKLAQKVYENSAPVKETIYNGGFIYENDTLQFLQTVEGRVLADRGYDGDFEGWEYQYHLKDHLGNVRLTFTTAKEEMVFEATMESEYAAIEEVMYSNLPQTRHTDLNGNHTTDESITANEAASLNGTDPNRTVGPVIVLPVYPGDTVKMEVFASYLEGTAGNATKISLAALTTAVAGAFGGSINGTEQAKAIYNAIEDALLLAGGATGNPNADVPSAFINYLLFDKNMVPLSISEGGFGYKAISDTAKQKTGPTHEKLELDPVAIEQEGFMYVYLSNESNVDVNVLFDDMKVTLVESPIVQTDDYYPFGLSFNSYFREGGKENEYLYNGKEFDEELNLGWYDYGARNYDAAIGRFIQIDPLANVLQENLSPYHYVKNNPIKYIDPTGMLWGNPGEAKKLEERIQKVISRLEKRRAKLEAKATKRKAKGKSTKNQSKAIARIDGRTTQLETSLENITTLGENQEYTFRLVSGDNLGNGKHGVARGDDGVINIHGSNNALHIHEIRHVALSLDSEKGMVFSSKDLLKPTTQTGKLDEIEGYKAQYGYSGNGPGEAESEDGIVENIANLKDKSGNYIYQAIRQRYLMRIKGIKRSEKYKRRLKKGKKFKFKQ